MNWGCLSFLILFPAGIFIWAAGEIRRRKAMPPEELKELEAEENFGSIDEKMECIFCYTNGCVRTRKETFYVEGDHEKNSPAGILDLCTAAAARSRLAEENRIKVHCMNCENDWEMFTPNQ